MYILANMWFTSLMRQFFYNIDKVVYNFISSLYDLLITIARTSVLTQADIAEMADRIYKLLAIFMIFKVTLSLITYVVNPDDFTDKSKGVSKLTLNIIISLSLLILTPYIFNYAFQFQTIILEDNSLATLIFGQSGDEEFLTTAGDDMAFITMSPFFTPNVSISELYDCTELTVRNSDGSVSFNPECSGLSSDLEDLGDANSLMGIVSEDRFNKTWLENYVSGVEAESLPLMFRQDMATATDENNENFIIDYRYLFSTVVGIVVVLLLITFCMDVGIRSIKLSFLQLIAPIPILSYVDPKSGKDGLFKKWYEMCFKTFLSLFIRLLALYFAVYIISKVADMKMVDIVDGSYVTNGFVAIFIIIGALMFAKQLPKMLEGLGIKLDGGGKFTLNPFKKFEEETIGGKRFSGAAGGMVAGLIGNKGNPFSALAGAARGFAGGKGYAGGLAAQADVNRKMREARIKGAGFWGSKFAGLSNRYGLDDADLEGKASRLRKDKRAAELSRREVSTRVKDVEVRKADLENRITPSETVISKANGVKGKIDAMEKKAVSYIESGKAGKYSRKYKDIQASYDTLSKNVGAEADMDHFNADGKKIISKGETITGEHVQMMQGEDQRYLNKVGRNGLMADLLTKKVGDETSEVGAAEQRIFDELRADYTESVRIYNEAVEANALVGASRLEAIDFSAQDSYTDEEAANLFTAVHAQTTEMETTAAQQARQIEGSKVQIERYNAEIKDIKASAKVHISGETGTISLEEAERILEEREKELKDTQDQRSLNRQLARDQRFFNGSGK